MESLLYDIKRNSEIIKRYFHEIRITQNSFMSDLQSYFQTLNNSISFYEQKLNESSQAYNPSDLISELLNLNSIEEYNEIIIKIQNNIKFSKDSDWKVESENIYLKKRKEIQELELVIGKFRKIFQQNLLIIRNELRKTFDISIVQKIYNPSKEQINEIDKPRNMYSEIIKEHINSTIEKSINQNFNLHSSDEIIIESDKIINDINIDQNQIKKYQYNPKKKESKQNYDPRHNLKKIIIKKQAFSYEGLLDDCLYRGKTEIHCHFCRNSNFETNLFRKLGKIYGPYKVGKNIFYFHEMCALWSNGIDVNANNSIAESIEGEVERTNKLKCSHCGEIGAGIHCLDGNCSVVSHFNCLIKTKTIKLNYLKLGFYCNEHFKKKGDNPDNHKEDFLKKLSQNSKKIAKKGN